MLYSPFRFQVVVIKHLFPSLIIDMHKWLIGLLLLLSFTLNAQNPISAKKEQCLEVGTGFLTFGDFIWYYDYDNPKLGPS